MRRFESPARMSFPSPGRRFDSPSRAALLSPGLLRKTPRIGLSSDELQCLREAFSLFDIDGSGIIDPKELKSELDALGFATKSPVVYWFIEQLAMEYATLTVDQCLTAMESRLAYTRRSRDVSDHVFECIDEEKKGRLSVSRVIRLAKELGETLTEEEVVEMVKKAANDTKEITKDDFYSLLVRKPHV